ncbi:hypothetical protein [Bradyrhizobium sp. Ec3.3]|uniref:hypothetical protein n=1 Tax=Bradyrhizobium sp. Ec3.3 TaxID=189753 RepID=UPI00068503CE|nr:hypothetical protein [Bradyrhizobium sp. Ec3.3]
MQPRKEPRQWTPPAPPPPRVPAAGPSKASAQPSGSEWAAPEYFVSFIFHVLFFGLIAGLLRTRFPLDLGLFIFFTSERMTEWALRKVGIRLVPDSLGETFVHSFVWGTGASILLTHWRAAAPAWLVPLGLVDPPWSMLVAMAVGCALLTAVSTAVVRRVLPWFGIRLARDSLAWTITYGLVGFAILGLVLLILAAL